MFLDERKAKKPRLGDRLYKYLLGASRNCKNSMLEQEEVKRQHLTVYVWLGICLHKRSLGASQDLETEMCDKKKGKRKLSVHEDRVIYVRFVRKKVEKP